MTIKKIVKESLKYSMRSKQYRYVYVSQEEQYLYDLIKDPIEKYDLAKNPEYRAVILDFKKHLQKMNVL